MRNQAVFNDIWYVLSTHITWYVFNLTMTSLRMHILKLYYNGDIFKRQ